jgi:hypothetical protein
MLCEACVPLDSIIPPAYPLHLTCVRAVQQAFTAREAWDPTRIAAPQYSPHSLAAR